ncbi:MAG TPA: SseB family protein, partial [Acidimicrobiales bacterium]|nr:SseB family protein [Acidimicrobiales bacterium]
MSPTPAESEVERLLQAAANDPVQRPAFNEALLRSDVYVLGVVEGDIVGGVAREGASVRLATTADDEGPLTPFFTSEDALQRYLRSRTGSDNRFIRLACRAFLEMTKGSRLALNLGSDYGK